ncbi:hypothetical protein [Nodularia sp. UHCC 0506]|uniref:hypothetical protein n=1 Tax=Nodularia sp. UHCC 0506 TaxID=3110243 RepID=UPI002B20CF50|nr:hypothetical protein [Nodularia sp. UHCC 0506]MEA5514141.1 hypothetical protein [Nodularia sp. UHCC 0506]
MSKTKTENNKPSKYQELNDFELEVVCGGAVINICDSDVSAPETINIKSDVA